MTIHYMTHNTAYLNTRTQHRLTTTILSFFSSVGILTAQEDTTECNQPDTYDHGVDRMTLTIAPVVRMCGQQ